MIQQVRVVPQRMRARTPTTSRVDSCLLHHPASACQINHVA